MSDTILYIGSSIFEAWTSLPLLLPGETIINEARGGTETSDWLDMIMPVLAKHDPAVVCYYCGSNDIGRGKDLDATVDNILAAFRKILAQYPEIRIVYYSIIMAPEKNKRWDDVRSCNQSIKNFLDSLPNGYYIELNEMFFDTEGKVRNELFVEDRLHLTEAAYREMLELVRPQMSKIVS